MVSFVIDITPTFFVGLISMVLLFPEEKKQSIKSGSRDTSPLW